MGIGAGCLSLGTLREIRFTTKILELYAINNYRTSKAQSCKSIDPRDCSNPSHRCPIGSDTYPRSISVHCTEI